MNIFSLLFHEAVHNIVANRSVACWAALLGAMVGFKVWLDLRRGWITVNKFTLRRAYRDKQRVSFWWAVGFEGTIGLFFFGCGLRGLIGYR